MEDIDPPEHLSLRREEEMQVLRQVSEGWEGDQEDTGVNGACGTMSPRDEELAVSLG